MSIRTMRWIAVATLAILILLAALAGWLNVKGDAEFAGSASSVAVTPQLVERGAYLARAGNCAACHTSIGGPAFAGGRGIQTPFGTVYASNLSPDVKTGIGGWSAGDFWRAMHNGRSKDGRLLYPAFPYPNFTQVTRADSDAIYAFLRSRPPASQANRAHELRFPYDTQAALAVWRALFFRPEVFEPQAEQTAEWNRGAYLVRGLGHCEACHSTRNLLGASEGGLELGGGMIPVQHWYAPALGSTARAGGTPMNAAELVGLLQTGTTPHGSALGPMAEVVFRSTQHLAPADLQSIATFLTGLQRPPASAPTPKRPDPLAMARGARLYKDRCADCHGDQGQGAIGAYPPLAGSRQLAAASPVNALRVVIDGGFAPATPGNPRPFGMPPFGQSLSHAEISDVVTYVRNAWGNQAAPASELDVIRSH